LKTSAEVTALHGFSYSESALKFLETVVAAKVRGQIKRKIEALAANPHPPGCKKLVGVDNEGEVVYRIRSGDYRVLYVVRSNPQQIIVLDIDNRKDIYR
jgi:mRNA interferase RelE/StbE